MWTIVGQFKEFSHPKSLCQSLLKCISHFETFHWNWSSMIFKWLVFLLFCFDFLENQCYEVEIIIHFFFRKIFAVLESFWSWICSKNFVLVFVAVIKLKFEMPLGRRNNRTTHTFGCLSSLLQRYAAYCGTSTSRVERLFCAIDQLVGSYRNSISTCGPLNVSGCVLNPFGIWIWICRFNLN